MMVDHNTIPPYPSCLETRHSVLCLQALLENSPIAIVVLDAEHRFTMCNPAFEKLFQYTPDQLRAENLDTLIAGPERAEEAAHLTQRVLGGNKVHMVAQRRRRDGMMVDVEIYGIPLMIDGELAGVYALYQDVTERNRAQVALGEMSLRMETLQIEERRRLARDLHDSTSQELALLNWNLTRLAGLVCGEDETLQKLVGDTRALARQCTARIRSASYLLLPPLLGEGGLTRAVPWMVEGFEQRSQIRVQLEMERDLGRFPDAAEGAIYRVLQEGLANVLRHSGSNEVDISLGRRGPWLEVRIEDRGRAEVGACETRDRPATGIGIEGMRGRLEELGGFLRVTPGARGTTLLAAIPVGGSLNECAESADCRRS